MHTVRVGARLQALPQHPSGSSDRDGVRISARVGFEPRPCVVWRVWLADLSTYSGHNHPWGASLTQGVRSPTLPSHSQRQVQQLRTAMAGLQQEHVRHHPEMGNTQRQPIHHHLPTHSLIPPTHSLTRSLTHPLILSHSSTHSLTHPPTHL